MLIPTRPRQDESEPQASDTGAARPKAPGTGRREPGLDPEGRRRGKGRSKARFQDPGSPSLRGIRTKANFDAARELADNLTHYSGTEWVSLTVVPQFIRTCLDRIRSRVCELSSTGVGRPGISPTVACCMVYGLQLLAANPEVRSLLEMKAALDALNSSDLDAADVDELAGWFRNFPLSVPDDRMIGVRRLNVTLPTTTKQLLYDLSSDLGASSSVLGVLALGIGIQTQPSMLDGHRDSLDAMVDTFYRRVGRRRRVAESLLSEARSHQSDQLDPGAETGAQTVE